jgi:hypothetical protein
MGFKKVGAAPTAPVAAAPAPAPTPAPPKGRLRAVAKPATIAPEAEPELPITPAVAEADAKPAAAPVKPKGIVPRSGPKAIVAAAVTKVAETAAEPDAATDAADPLSWAHSGAEAEAIAAAAVAQREEAQAERKARGYWPQRFELIPPGTQSRNGPINDRHQADIILLDDAMGPSFWEHVLRNARTGRYDVIEPCPKEFDNCPICPPAGERESGFVSLLSALNINGYTIKTGARAGQHIPITKELLVPWAADFAFFAELAKEHGGLRGIQLTMTRQPKVTQDGEKLEEEDWLMHPFRYAEFLHRPSGADLRARYGGSAGGTGTGGGAAPIGARTNNDPEWGGGRYQPGAAGGPAGKAPGGFEDLDDDVPF